MLFDLWEVSFSEQDLAADEGGYEGARLRTKENIVLQRTSQHLLKRISASRSLDCCFDPIEFYSTQFSLEFLPYISRGNKRELPKWPNVAVEPLPEYNQELTKERIKIESQSLEVLKWLHGLRPFDPKFPNIERIKIDGLEMLMLDLHLISMEKVLSSRPKNPAAMPSVFQDRFMSLTDESIEERAVSQCTGKYSPEPFSIVGPLMEGYIIHCISVKDNVRHEKPWNCEEWPAPREIPCEKVFQDLQVKLLDHDFNPLDFYKLKVSKMTSKLLKRNKFSAHKVWKISKEQIRELDWNPLKRLTQEATTTILPKDVIAAKEYRPRHVSLTFPVMMYNSIDLIDAEHKTFGSLKIDNWQTPVSVVEGLSTGEMTMEKQSSSFSKEKDSQENTKISTSLLPHGRSFVDEELTSMLEVKQRKLAGGKEKLQATSQPASVNMLRTLNKVSNNQYSQNEQISLPAESSPTAKAVPLATPFQELGFYNIKKSVLVNLSRLKYNHSIIRYLAHGNNKISLIEQEQILPYDFVLNSSTCIIRVQLNTFFQMKNSNDLYYASAFTELLTEFRRVIVLVEYRDLMETADRDVFWKIRLYLNRPEFEVHLTSADDEAIGSWICILAKKYSGQFRESEASSTSEEFLLALNLNKFQVQTLLGMYSLSSILLMILDEDSSQLEDKLSPLQVQRIKNMMILEW